MKGPHSDRARLNHILDAINAIQEYVYECSYEEFSSSSEKTFATVKQLEIIGEAANRTTETTKSSNPHIEWSKIIAMRNILVHEYFVIDHTIIWDIIQDELPTFRIQIVEILSSMD